MCAHTFCIGKGCVSSTPTPNCSIAPDPKPPTPIATLTLVLGPNPASTSLETGVSQRLAKDVVARILTLTLTRTYP